MTDQSPNSITFKLRSGKILELVFCELFCLALIAFQIWIIFSGSNLGLSLFTIFMILALLGFIFGFIALGFSIFRTNLTFSDQGLLFQSVFKSNRVSWNDVKGFYDFDGETWFYIEDKNGSFTPQKGIPLSWFTKLPSSDRPQKADEVMSKLMVYAPQLFKNKSAE